MQRFPLRRLVLAVVLIVLSGRPTLADPPPAPSPQGAELAQAQRLGRGYRATAGGPDFGCPAGGSEGEEVVGLHWRVTQEHVAQSLVRPSAPVSALDSRIYLDTILPCTRCA